MYLCQDLWLTKGSDGGKQGKFLRILHPSGEARMGLPPPLHRQTDGKVCRALSASRKCVFDGLHPSMGVAWHFSKEGKKTAWLVLCIAQRKDRRQTCRMSQAAK